ncbi:hypothetical protein B0O99DRAFT_693517 [Bisporella sp. PMI_857]|nr:hypothetical protein B0O99DRAFT_693517 [Bisporella sp. PMI_857]
MCHSSSGKALRVEDPRDMTKALAEMVMTQQVDWPNMSNFPDASHILDFGPGRVALLQRHAVIGPKARVIIASDLSAVSDDFGNEEELFSLALHLPESNSNSLYQPSKMQRQDGISNISEEATAPGAVKTAAISGEPIPSVPQVGRPPLAIPQ